MPQDISSPAPAGSRSARIRRAITVRGRVQGVGYRFFVREHARADRLTGWVRNEADGSVSMEVQGERNVVEDFCEILGKGPVLSYVSGMKAADVPLAEDETGFIVRY